MFNLNKYLSLLVIHKYHFFNSEQFGNDNDYY